jgi:hypothetical protein
MSAAPSIIPDNRNGQSAVVQARCRRRHWEALLAAMAVVGLAFLLDVRPDQRVAFSGFPHVPLPETCPSRRLLHFDCPGCGLTRSFIHLAHGNWRESWNVHRVGSFLALAVVLQIPYRLAALSSHSGLPLGTRAPRLFGMLLFVLLIVNWLINLLSRLLN